MFVEQSVRICEDNNTGIAKDPVEFLTARHNNSNNYDQALKVYRGQCRKSEEHRQGIRIVHQELIEKDFMKKLIDLIRILRTLLKCCISALQSMENCSEGRFYFNSGKNGH